MGNKITDELITAVRSVVCNDFTDMDIIRALHMGNNDVTAAINIIFDTPNFGNKERTDARRSPGISSRKSKKEMAVVEKPERISNESRDCLLVSEVAGARTSSMPECTLESVEPVTPQPSTSNSTEWLFLGDAELAALSTCKGRKLKAGDEVMFSFPCKQSKSPSTSKFPGRGRVAAACSEIVRFSTKDSVEIGRIPNEWARCLLPLVNDRKVRIEGCCKYAPDVLSIVDPILLSVSVYISGSMFQKRRHLSPKLTRNVSEESVVHPLPTLFKLVGLVPFKKAEFTPEEFYTRKRPLESKDSSVVHASLFHVDKSKKPSVHESTVENSQESISNSDLESIVSVGETSELQELDPPNSLCCELRPYQKQALYWMIQVEKGGRLEEAAATMMHPCWDAYHLGKRRDVVVYLNAFSGDATTEFPSTLQMSRGGILADAMGLGKTIMTIALLLAYTDRGAPSSGYHMSQAPTENSEVSSASDESPSDSKKVTKFSGFDMLMKSRTSFVGGGNLIVCPMTLLGQWKAEIESHAKPGSLSIYAHYGQSRPKDTKLLAENDVVLTTYGVLSSEYSAENAESNGGLYSVRWFRVVLDEAHTIKSSKSQISIAVAALTADRRWCLTGTPIQNSLEDIYSLLRFLKVEPWGNWAWWYKLIQKPFEEGDERGLKLVQSVLRPIMLRRTKSTMDREGRPILVLPPADIRVIYCEPTAAEKDLYDALFKRSKVKFDQFVEEGRVLHNYASILELLLRLRQCCDHPFLVMSRGDTQEFSDLNKLAKRFLKGGEDTPEVSRDVPSRAYIQEVVEELRKGEKGECPICLEAFEDAVLTPCAHRLCRECLLGSWRSPTSGLCPVCRKIINRQELITAPTDSRFRINVEENWVESSKVTFLLQELENLRSSGSKSIVFSQWTAFLDLLQIPLSRNNFHFVRLDGTLNQQQRDNVIKQFSEDSGILVLLLSLKAGGVGINLTAASSAFIMDPWWNPAVEEQAVMRIHRIGQTKRVIIRRFIVKGTVEERMEAVQARKQRMISGALTDQEVRTARMEELKMLFA